MWDLLALHWFCLGKASCPLKEITFLLPESFLLLHHYPPLAVLVPGVSTGTGEGRQKVTYHEEEGDQMDSARGCAL